MLLIFVDVVECCGYCCLDVAELFGYTTIPVQWYCRPYSVISQALCSDLAGPAQLSVRFPEIEEVVWKCRKFLSWGGNGFVWHQERKSTTPDTDNLMMWEASFLTAFLTTHFSGWGCARHMGPYTWNSFAKKYFSSWGHFNKSGSNFLNLCLEPTPWETDSLMPRDNMMIFGQLV